MNTAQPIDTDRIDGTPRTVRELFTSRKYALDYYQREYNWSEQNIVELIDDLAGRFGEEYNPGHDREEVARYRPYFLGPIVTSNRGGMLFLVDGQQRLTTLILVLMYLHHLQKGLDDVVDVAPLVYSSKFGKPSFNLDTPGRRACMQAILDGHTFDLSNADGPEKESVEHLWTRYQDIEERFPAELKSDALPYFVDWLLERVVVVEIATADEEMALEIFETMNDRGLRLSTTDMLKGYLLSNIRNSEAIAVANDLWRARVAQLAEVDRNADADFLKSWMRAKFADTIRERKKDAAPGDWDIIGTAVHKWVRDRREDVIGLYKPSDFDQLISRDFERLSRRYLQLLAFSQKLTPGFEHVFYNATNGFTFQYQTILAALTPVDDEETFQRKVRMVAGYLDLFVARRMVNYRNFGYSTVSYTMFNLAKDIRDLDPDELADVLGARVAEMTESLSGISTFGLNQRNRSHVRYLLARIAGWLDSECGSGPGFAEYVDRGRAKPFEIEHVWANHFDRHVDEFSSEHDFVTKRDQIGDLLLLPKDFNASYGDMEYSAKLPHYNTQNLLARSLHPLCYENNPSFVAAVARHDLPFKAYPASFPASAVGERQDLYRRIAEMVWDPATLGLRVPEIDEAAAGKRRMTVYGVTFRQLVDAGMIPPGSELVGAHSGQEFTALVTAEGRIHVGDTEFDAPSPAAMAALDRPSWNGWAWWRVKKPGGTRPLSRIRQDFIEQRRSKGAET
jgi:hypothetical protein